jgi:hypothetical protein
MGGGAMITIYGINEAIAIEKRVLQILDRHGDHKAYETGQIDSAVSTTAYRLEALEHIRDNLNET